VLRQRLFLRSVQAEEEQQEQLPLKAMVPAAEQLLVARSLGWFQDLSTMLRFLPAAPEVPDRMVQQELLLAIQNSLCRVPILW
jgi:hypothetical protein